MQSNPLTVLSVVFILVLTYTSTTSSQYVNVTCDNTFELYVDGVALISPLCPDDQCGESGANPPGLSCFWSNITRMQVTTIHAGSVVAIHGHNTGVNTNPFRGGLDPGAFLLTVTAADGTICGNSDLGGSWQCTDDLALAQYTGNSTPPSDWNLPSYFPGTPLWGGPLSDLGVNNVDSWEYLTNATVASTWPNSIWYEAIPGGPKPIPGISLDAHWVWYRYDLPNQDIYCRLIVGDGYAGCTAPSASRSVSASMVSKTPTASVSLTVSVTSTVSTTKSVSNSVSPSLYSSKSPSTSFSPSLSGTTSPSLYSSLSSSRSPSLYSSLSSSVSPSLYSSLSATGSPSLYSSNSASASPSLYSSLSGSGSPSLYSSSSASVSPSLYSSNSASASPSLYSSLSGSGSPSLYSSNTASASSSAGIGTMSVESDSSDLGQTEGPGSASNLESWLFSFNYVF